VAAKDWSGAAVAAADGLNKSASSASSSKRTWLLIAIGVAVVVVVVVVLVLYRARRRRRAARRLDPRDGQRVTSLGQALSIAEARLGQISEYIARHRESIGAEARAHDKEASDAPDATAHANRASTLFAEVQAMANADARAAHRNYPLIGGITIGVRLVKLGCAPAKTAQAARAARPLTAAAPARRHRRSR
jgi:hypothetical protein